MAKSLSSPIRLHEFARVTSPKKLNDPSSLSRTRAFASKPSNSQMENPEKQNRIPLAMVVSDCARRWFQDTLKEAKGGDISMQILVGQMYYSGYGIPRDAQKGKVWLNRASRSRSSVWKVGEKHPGYNASDSDSDEVKDDKDV